MIQLDYTYSLRKKNRGGILEEELDDVLERLETINRRIQENPYPFMKLPYLRFELTEMKNLVRSLKKKDINDVVLLGIGGSSLGTEAIFKALLPHDYYLRNIPKYWILDNIDPYTVGEVVEKIEKEKTLLIVVSKSGETPETLAQFMLFKEILKDVTDIKEKTVIITDRQKGFLKRIADKEGYFCLSVPEGVGGRFSVLTPVGMFPALLMGIDVEGILDGAREMAEHIRRSSKRENMALIISALLYLMDQNGKKIHVMMPYCDRLSGFSEWFRQLEAESLGKEGKGPTPIYSRGVTDQHSQLQLYVDGPKDKFIIFMYSPSDGPHIPESFPYIRELSYFAGKSLEKLFRAELVGTKLSVLEASVPSAEIWIEKVSAFSLGALFYLFEMVITFFGELTGVNPFDQPGVEKGKIYTKALMGMEAHEETRRHIEALETQERATVSF